MRQEPPAERRNRFGLPLLGLIMFAFVARQSGATAADSEFIGDYCASCHNDVDRKGRLDLTSLELEPNDPASLAVWVRVHDRVKAGEMPPKDCERPDGARQKAFVEEVAQAIIGAEKTSLAGEGRSLLRRLNRQEYENALRDLLGVPGRKSLVDSLGEKRGQVH